MTNWKLLASARGLEIPETELNRLGDALGKLEAAFHLVIEGMPPETDSALVFHSAPEDE